MPQDPRESQVPIIMLTARGEDVDRILGLEMGADDYLAKPFNPRELLARINAVLRRQAAAQTASAVMGATALTFQGWRIDFRLRELRNPAGARVAMTSAEFDLLRAFCERPGRVLSRDSLLDLTQGRNAGSFERSIDVLVSRIRRKIETDPQDSEHDQDRPLGRISVHTDGGGLHRISRWRQMRLRDFLNLRTIGGQITALVIASIIAIHLILAGHLPDQPPGPAGSRPSTAVTRNLPQRSSCSARPRRPTGPRLIADLARAFPKLDIETLPPGPIPEASDPKGLDMREPASAARQHLSHLSARQRPEPPQGRHRACPTAP